MKKYRKYKDSGVEWIGEIPEHWGFPKINFFIDGIKDGTHGTHDRVDNGYYLLSSKNVHDSGIQITENESFISESEHLSIVKNGFPQKGDVLLTVVGTIGRCCVYNFDYPISFQRSVCFIRPKRLLLSEFLKYLIQSDNIQVQLIGLTKTSSQGGVYMNDVKELKIYLPTFSEQLQIVEFLDKKTSLIDTLIEKKLRKIELLKEERTSIINHTVTKGLNPNVRMKDSGVEWIGEMPQGWDSIRMKYLCEMINEKGETNDGDIKISPENVESFTGNCFDLYSEYNGEGVRFNKGDVLLNKLRLYLVKILNPDYDGFSMGEMIVLRPRKIYGRYLFYTLFNQGLIDILDCQSTGVKLPRVSPEIILNSLLPYPPQNEQKDIVLYLDKKTSEIDTQINLENKKIDLLKEYRQSLISEVVTGKIDVRKN